MTWHAEFQGSVTARHQGIWREWQSRATLTSRRVTNRIRVRPTSLNQATLSQTVAGATTRGLVRVEVHMPDLALNHTLRLNEPTSGEKFTAVSWLRDDVYCTHTVRDSVFVRFADQCCKQML